MAQILVNPFDHRQTMKRENYEIFHYNNPETCTCPPHQHDFYELFCLLDDSLDYIVEGRRYAMKPGSIILIAPGQLHRADVPVLLQIQNQRPSATRDEYFRHLWGSCICRTQNHLRTCRRFAACHPCRQVDMIDPSTSLSVLFAA